MQELKDALGPGEVLEPMLSQVSKAGAPCQTVAGEIGGRLREQDLAAVRRLQEAGDTIQRRPEVVALSLLCRAGMKRHSHPQGFDLAPFLGVQGALRGQSSPK